MSRSYDNTTPKRIIYFADGDVTGECGTEEDEDRAADTWPCQLSLSVPVGGGEWPASAIDSVASSTYSAFQLVGSTFGGRFAAFFGLTEPKHQCGLNEHPRTQTKVDGVLPGPPRALRPEGYFAS
nr:protein FAM177B [Rattus norvegicus]